MSERERERKGGEMKGRVSEREAEDMTCWTYTRRIGRARLEKRSETMHQRGKRGVNINLEESKRKEQSSQHD